MCLLCEREWERIVKETTSSTSYPLHCVLFFLKFWDSFLIAFQYTLFLFSFTLIILTSFLRLVIFLYLFVSLCLPQNITLHFWYLFCNVVVVFFLQLLIVRRGQKDTEMCFSCFQCCCYFFFWLISTYFLCCFCKKKIKSCWT